MKRWLKTLLLIIAALAILLALGVGLYLQQPKFGALPEGARLARMQASPRYVSGQFENQLPTPQVIGDRGFIGALWSYLFSEKTRTAPSEAIPSVKTDLLQLDRGKDVVVWLGHSSYFIQLQGKTILVDPVFSPSAAPIPFANKAFSGANPYTADDLPEIDYLLISHDHWDHLDYPTLVALQSKVKNVIGALGIGSYFEKWGFSDEQIQETDWFTTLELEDGLAIHVLPARHYSSRTLTKNKTLWAGFALTSPKQRIFISGDSGYGPHFKEIGERFGGFDLVMLDSGQYDKNWPYIHMTPEEAVQAAEDLKGKAFLPAHAGKFALANHPWDEPYQRAAIASQDKSFRLLTPVIGDPVYLDDRSQHFPRWWETVQ